MSQEMQHTGKAIQKSPYEHCLGDMGYESRIFLKVIAFNKDDLRKPDQLVREPAASACQFFGGASTTADVAATCIALINTTRDLIEAVAENVARTNPAIKKGQFIKGVYAEAQGLNLQHPERRLDKRIDPVSPRRREREDDDAEAEDAPAAPAV